MTKLLFDPIARITAVTAIDDEPDLHVGDQVTVPLRVVEITRCPIDPIKAFWHITLEPCGRPLAFAAGPPIHIEVDIAQHPEGNRGAERVQ